MRSSSVRGISSTENILKSSLTLDFLFVVIPACLFWFFWWGMMVFLLRNAGLGWQLDPGTVQGERFWVVLKIFWSL